MKSKDLFGRPLNSGQKSVLGQRFRFPPFSVLNAREGDWQDRKREWIALGIQSELGRGEALTWDEGIQDIDEYRHREGTRPLATTYHIDRNDYPKANAAPGGSPMPAADYSKSKARGDGHGRPINKYHAQPGGGPSHKSVWLGANGKPVGGNKAINSGQANSIKNGLTFNMAMQPEEYDNGKSQTGTSIFDPVICELFYRWFTPPNGKILDPFAGGSVRGVVASILGRQYVGVDLRPEQVTANEKQAEIICNGLKPEWITGDSRDIIDLVCDEYGNGHRFDALLSCPPYFDLELYSGDERDLSNTSWKEFKSAYQDIISQSVALLKNNRFACFVVGDIRDKEGFYRGLPSLTIECFEEAGCRLYNEAVLVTAVGSLPLRIHRQFSASRKLGRTHQSMLVFVKGDPKIATEACEDIEFLSMDIRDGNQS